MRPTERKGASPTVDEIRRALAARPPAPLTERLPSAAAVAMVLWPGDDGLAALFIRRAEHPRDPWSGHVAFPGGRADSGESSVDTAIRETLEEVGVDLRRGGELLGGLDEIQAIGRGGALGLSIRAWVFALRDPPPPFILSDEVASAHWVALGELLDPARRAPYPYVYQGTELVLPSIRVAGLTIWGLTYRMIEAFQEVLGTSRGEPTR